MRQALSQAYKREVSHEQKDEIFEKFVAANWQEFTDKLYAAAAKVEDEPRVK